MREVTRHVLLLLTAAVVSLPAAGLAQHEWVEDFESYSVGDGLHHKLPWLAAGAGGTAMR